jgi:hypothetical protein
VFPQNQADKVIGQTREKLLVVCFDLRLLDNLNAAVESVGCHAVAQVCFT